MHLRKENQKMKNHVRALIATLVFVAVLFSSVSMALGNLPSVDVDIDIKPCSCPNAINIKNKGLIPVAVFGSATFDVADIIVSTVRFGRTGTEAEVHLRPNGKYHFSFEYVNADSYLDMVFHFPTQDTGFQIGDEVGYLKGQTDSVSFIGSGSVKIIGPP
jgi:hypothetical protein